jgi:RNA polymerase sigma-70 factor (ECF subfamily)
VPGQQGGGAISRNRYLRETEAQVEDSELRQNLWQALGRLSVKDRAALVQRYYLDLSETQMARDMQVTTGTVKWRLHQARKRLRQQLERGQR